MSFTTATTDNNTKDGAIRSAQDQLIAAAAEANDVGIRLFLSGNNFESAAEAFQAAHRHFSAALSIPSTTVEANNAGTSSTSSTPAPAPSTVTAAAATPSLVTSSNNNIPSTAHPVSWPLPSSTVRAAPVRIDAEAVKRRRTRCESDVHSQPQSSAGRSSGSRAAAVCYNRELSAVLFNLALCHHTLGYQHYSTYLHASSYLATEEAVNPNGVATHLRASLSLASSRAANATATHFGATLSLYSQCNTCASKCGYRGEVLVAVVKAALGNSAQIRACVIGDVDGAQELLEEMEAVHDITETAWGAQEEGEESLSFAATVRSGRAARSSGGQQGTTGVGTASTA